MRLFLITLIFLPLISKTRAQDLYFPAAGNEWESLAPESINWCPDQIDSLYSYLEKEQSKSFIILKDGKIVLEKYFGTYTADSLWPWFSAGKSLRAVLIGIAQEEGLLNINDKTSDYLGMGWTSLAAEKEDLITIWHQLTMTTGLNELLFDCTLPACLLYKADAGTRWAYHNSPYNLLKEVLENATGQGINLYTNQKVKNKIGMGSGIWIPVDNNTFFLSKARDMARFGLLIQNNGIWESETVLGDMDYFNQMLNSSQELNPSYGYLWWLNGKTSYIAPDNPSSLPGPISPDAPSDVILAAGSQGQFISISPSLGLIMIRQGKSASEDKASIDLHNEIWKKINELECVVTGKNPDSPTVKISPNPARDHISIEGLSLAKVKIKILDQYGKVLIQTENQTSIPLSNLPQGVYFVSIQSEIISETRKIEIHKF